MEIKDLQYICNIANTNSIWAINPDEFFESIYKCDLLYRVEEKKKIVDKINEYLNKIIDIESQFFEDTPQIINAYVCTYKESKVKKTYNNFSEFLSDAEDEIQELDYKDNLNYALKRLDCTNVHIGGSKQDHLNNIYINARENTYKLILDDNICKNNKYDIWSEIYHELQYTSEYGNVDYTFCLPLFLFAIMPNEDALYVLKKYTDNLEKNYIDALNEADEKETRSRAVENAGGHSHWGQSMKANSTNYKWIKKSQLSKDSTYDMDAMLKKRGAFDLTFESIDGDKIHITGDAKIRRQLYPEGWYVSVKPDVCKFEIHSSGNYNWVDVKTYFDHGSSILNFICLQLKLFFADEADNKE